jgi:hypothetical protein
MLDFTVEQQLFSSFAIGNVSKIPDSAPIGAFGVDERRRVSVEGLPILESELVPALFMRMAAELLDLLEEGAGFLDFVRHKLADDVIV